MSLRPRKDGATVLAGDPEVAAVPGALRGFGGIAVGLLVALGVLGEEPRAAVALDVLLVLAGFLVVRHGLAAVHGGSWSVGRGLTRALRTLLPVTVVVLLAAAVATAVSLPSSWWPQIQADVVASVLLVQNWHLALFAPATAPGGALAGPLAYLWALAVLGQLLLGVVLVLGLAVALAGRLGRRVETVLAVLLLVITVASGVWATVGPAPLDTAARAWVFAGGGLLATAPGTWALRSRPTVGLSTLVGLAGIAAALLSSSPLVPIVAVLGALTVVHALAHGPATAVSRLLGLLPLRTLGAVALPLYLWAGLVLGFYLVWRGRPEVGLRGSAVVLGVAVVLALVTRAVRRCAPRSRRGGDGSGGGGVGGVGRLRSMAALVVTLVLATGGWYVASTLRPGAFVAAADPAHPGAAARLPGYGEVPAGPVLPGPESRAADWAPGASRCRTSPLEATLRICGEPVADPPFRVVAVGDSHVEQLLPAVRPIVDERRGQLVTMLRGACPFSTGSDTVPGDGECAAWNRAAISEIVALRADLVVTLGSRDGRSALTEETPAGFVEAWRELERAGIPVLAIRDNPRLPFSPTDCVDAQPTDPGVCAAPRAPLVAASPPWTRSGPLPGNVVFLDLADTYCTDTACPAVVGNVLIYLDANHVSATFTGTAAPVVAPALLRAMEHVTPGY
ncbi:SGNH hydrolase domain-containing protein [Actinomycetospora chibensis]|uniref:SGNH hydrolase domain-containing protein n=1 Tax=Actinomycetospora chibensis TaxID=663606 RepID=A0ABV9RHR2_9PSEU|nr:SGNH hydrolase domain-containing protein [Actinomycetospora chibensis]MDD7922504.1 SGNH hydrolase domain-containing protein [Actinomycetospora chibensis]